MHAKDAAADVMLVAWRRLDDVPRGDQARLWLFGVARKVVSEAQRSQRRQIRLDAKAGSAGDLPEPGPEVHVVRRAEDEELIRAIKALREKDREIIELRIWDELSRAEVATLLDISVAGVDKRLGRALSRLRKSLDARARRHSDRTSDRR